MRYDLNYMTCGLIQNLNYVDNRRGDAAPALAPHADDRGSIPGRDKPKALLPNARQQVSMSHV